MRERRGDALWSGLWAITSLAVLLFAAARRRHDAAQIGTLVAQVDSLRKLATRARSFDMIGLAPGDTLPDAMLVAATGPALRTHELARLHIHLILFYRHDCGACQLAERYWRAAADPRQSGVIKVAYSANVDMRPDSGVGYFAWQHTDATRNALFIQHVPTLVALDSVNRVVSVAEGLPQVAKLGGYLGLVNQAAIDSVRAAAAAATRRGEQPDTAGYTKQRS